MSSKTNQDVVTVMTRQDLPTPFIDTIQFSVREDQMNLLRFSTNLPEGRLEQVRFFCDKNFLVKMVDLICEVLDYYPTKKDVEGKVKKKPAK